MTNAEAWFNKSLRPQKPEGSLGRTAQDVHLDSHTAPELCFWMTGPGCTLTEDASWPEIDKVCKNVYLNASFGCAINSYNTTEVLFFFFASNLSCSGLSHVGSVLLMKSRNRLAPDVFDIFATYVSLVCDTIGTDCWVQRGSTHWGVFMVFKPCF